MLKVLVLHFTPASAMADCQETTVSAFRRVFGNVSVSGCWFHYAQSIVKRLHELGLKDDYVSEATVQDTVRCLLGLPLLPVDDIRPALDDVKDAAADDSGFTSKLHDLIRYAVHFLLIDFLDSSSVLFTVYNKNLPFSL